MFGRWEDDRLATKTDACREWAWNVGEDARYADSQWILTDYDTWERNPHYHGPAQEHPYDAEAREDYERSLEDSQMGFEEFEYRQSREIVNVESNVVAPDYLDDDIPF
jgi:hypothetical protein